MKTLITLNVTLSDDDISVLRKHLKTDVSETNVLQEKVLSLVKECTNNQDIKITMSVKKVFDYFNQEVKEVCACDQYVKFGYCCHL